MKIGIEAQRIFRKKKHGMDMVVLELIRNLQRIDTRNEYFIFVSPDEDNAVITETDNFRIVEIEGGFYPLWEQVALPLAARRYGCNILHCTSNTAPVVTSIPLVVTLHDIIYMESSFTKILGGSGSAYQKFGNVYRKIVVPAILKKSRRTITVSEFERRRIGEFFNLGDDRRLQAVYNGVSSHFKPVTDKAELQRVREKYNLPERYFFFLGNTDPKKNTRGTLQAFSDFIKKTGKDIYLVMLDYEKSALEKLLADIGDPLLIKHIVLTGYVSNTDLPAIYSQCELFLYTSLRESFGIPMLEAMACGAAVITSNTSSMPEVAGDAAIFADPFRPDQIVDAITMLMADDKLKTGLAEKGFLRASQFTWESMAKQVLDIYNQVYSETNK